eukprot:13990778-Alexandrium_andersonii.AAC.1
MEHGSADGQRLQARAVSGEAANVPSDALAILPLSEGCLEARARQAEMSLARQALVGARADMADVIEHWSVTTPSGHAHQIHLDNGTVRSGERRARARCPRPGHSACFKYRQLNQFTSVRKCVRRS